jgi:hypothetical protein
MNDAVSRALHVVPAPDSPSAEGHEEAVLAAMRGIRFGSVEVIIHEGRIVQINRVEKVRMER